MNNETLNGEPMSDSATPVSADPLADTGLDASRDAVGMNIGAVAAATSIPENTLRTWERRYGFPKPERGMTGQRLYRPELIGHLRLASQALARGHRPSQVMTASEAELRQLLLTTLPADAPRAVEVGDMRDQRPVAAAKARSSDVPTVVSAWLDAARALDGATLERGFQTELGHLGLIRFLSERVGPFLAALGQGWRDGQVAVFHEHFATERLRDMLVRMWHPLAERAQGPLLICTTLPGETHGLGLHMAACVAALHGQRIVFLGEQTPIADITRCAETVGAHAVLVSMSAFTRTDAASALLNQLRASLHGAVELVAGGSGAPDSAAGVRVLTSLESLNDWARGG
jgi:MerR family transcriptional regulator, light-induced transcriptional regulator